MTWSINRTRTFGDRAERPSLAEFGRYLAASLAAAAVNLGVYMVLVTFVAVFRSMPVLAVAIATLVSMGVNFWSYATVVFSSRRGVEPVSDSRDPARPS